MSDRDFDSKELDIKVVFLVGISAVYKGFLTHFILGVLGSCNLNSL